MSMGKVFPIFAAAFAVIYVLAVQYNWPCSPIIRKSESGSGWPSARNGPPMYWYGWLVTSALGATAVSLLSWPLARRGSTQYWLGWVVPIVVVVVFVYLFRSFFIR